MSEITTPKSQKWQGMTLAEYVHHRTGLPLGASGSLKNMLRRSLGAGSFAGFWQYWNPIWGYGLGRYIYKPLQRIFPAAIALLLTFVVSGAIHDAVTMLVRRRWAFLFVPWFTMMGILVIIGRALKLDYANLPFAGRVAINLTYVLGCLALTKLLF